jgi:D-xylose transport system ATP-binding protein
MKVLSGVYPHGTFTGSIRIRGQEARFHSVKDSERAGIGIIHQELNLIPELAVYENMFLGQELGRGGIISPAAMQQEAQKLLRQLNLHVPATEKIKNLGIGEQQLVEIARAIKNKTDILVLDEPTAALTDKETEIVLGIILDLKQRGTSIIYISHKLKEVMSIADTITVLRDGKTIGTHPAADMTESKIITMMVGRDLSTIFPKRDPNIGECALEVMDWNVYDRTSGRHVVQDVSFEVRKGEILGIAGLVGAGRTELVSSIFGAYPGKSSGTIRVFGKRVVIRRPGDAMEHGIGLVTEDRKEQGLVRQMNIQQNATLARISRGLGLSMLNQLDEVASVSDVVEKLRVKFRSLETPVRTLSGGNQQKVVLAKWMLIQPKILILDEPTRGIDVGAKHEIYELMNELTREGMAIIMVSSELPEVLGMSDRILVMANGRVQGTLIREEASEVKVLELAMGREHHV